ncbi:MAG: ROK family protein [Bacteroidetes bacterium]|nr:ROK family protein [Bacteroidota bacterium]
MKDVVTGIDIGGTNSVFGVVDKTGNILAEGTVPTAQFENADDFLEEMSVKIKGELVKLKGKCRLKGIGVGAPNGNYYKGTIEFAPNLPWKGVLSPAQNFRKFFDLPVALTNDANAAAIGEMLYGGAKGMKDFIVITLGTGLGSGIVVNGEVVYGHDGFAGEIGHTIVEPDGRTCGCGRKGCLETYASAGGLVRTANELLASFSAPSRLREINRKNVSSRDIAEAARKGDKIALKAFDITAKILGRRLADSVAYTGPEAIFLFGGLAKSGGLILEPTKRYMDEYLLKIYKGKVRLLISELIEKNAAVLGSAALAWKELGAL